MVSLLFSFLILLCIIFHSLCVLNILLLLVMSPECLVCVGYIHTANKETCLRTVPYVGSV